MDVFSPNAAGGVLNGDTVPRLRARAVVGGANEQLLDSRHGDALHARGILYAPDYVANAGGLLSLLFETGQCDEAGVADRVRAIGPRLAALWERADAEGLPPHRLADRMVEERLAAARSASMKMLTTGGGAIAYDVQGEGPPVLFLHAFPLGAAHVGRAGRGPARAAPGDPLRRPRLRRLAARRRAARHGAHRGRRGGAARPPRRSAGPSCAGCRWAATRPSRWCAATPTGLRGLVLADTKAPGDTAEARQDRATLAEKVLREGAPAAADAFVPKLLGETTKRDRPQVSARVREMILGNPPRGIADALAGLAARADSTGTLREIRVPMLVVCGEEDALTPPSDAEALQQGHRGQPAGPAGARGTPRRTWRTRTASTARCSDSWRSSSPRSGIAPLPGRPRRSRGSR